VVVDLAEVLEGVPLEVLVAALAAAASQEEVLAEVGNLSFTLDGNIPLLYKFKKVSKNGSLFYWCDYIIRYYATEFIIFYMDFIFLLQHVFIYY
jgi:hypothetical protein